METILFVGGIVFAAAVGIGNILGGVGSFGSFLLELKDRNEQTKRNEQKPKWEYAKIKGMKDKPLSVTVSDTWNGDSFTQTTTEDGAEFYTINGTEVSKELWSKEVEAAELAEMEATAGEEPQL